MNINCFYVTRETKIRACTTLFFFHKSETIKIKSIAHGNLFTLFRHYETNIHLHSRYNIMMRVYSVVNICSGSNGNRALGPLLVITAVNFNGDKVYPQGTFWEFAITRG